MLRPLQWAFYAPMYPDLLSGLDTPDDAAVWKLDDERALVVTTDFFTPIVDDPFDYGMIAAANSLSDIYAMGAKPFMALNIAAMPPSLPPEMVTTILRGGINKCKEARVVVAGGHTISDEEPKYGLVALGFVHPERMLTKNALKPGDVLFLSKRLGTGSITTAMIQDKISDWQGSSTIQSMRQLNAEASEIALKHGARAATDISGFGLLGHAWEMAEASHVGLHIDFDALPFIAWAIPLAREGVFPGGAYDNAEYFSQFVDFHPYMRDEQRLMTFDPQTSGGLLFGIPKENADACQHDADVNLVKLWRIGEVTESNRIEVTRGDKPRVVEEEW